MKFFQNDMKMSQIVNPYFNDYSGKIVAQHTQISYVIRHNLRSVYQLQLLACQWAFINCRTISEAGVIPSVKQSIRVRDLWGVWH